MLEIDDVTREESERIERLIQDATSPVGIDAKKTHVLILHKLQRLEERLERIERHLTAPPSLPL